jgi:hypothetical protein
MSVRQEIEGDTHSWTFNAAGATKALELLGRHLGMLVGPKQGHRSKLLKRSPLGKRNSTGQGEAELRPDPRCAIGPHRPTVPLDRPHHIGKADPRARILGIPVKSFERHEQLVHVPNVESDPLVSNEENLPAKAPFLAKFQARWQPGFAVFARIVEKGLEGHAEDRASQPLRLSLTCPRWQFMDAERLA